MSNIISLDEVMISPATHDAWMAFAKRVAEALRVLGVTDPSQIPDEQCRINADGSLTIFVTLPNCEVSMDVPPDHWAYRSRH